MIVRKSLRKKLLLNLKLETEVTHSPMGAWLPSRKWPKAKPRKPKPKTKMKTISSKWRQARLPKMVKTMSFVVKRAERALPATTGQDPTSMKVVPMLLSLKWKTTDCRTRSRVLTNSWRHRTIPLNKSANWEGSWKILKTKTKPTSKRLWH